MDIKALYEIYKQYPIVLTDTRKIVSGSLFFALKGRNFNGNTFAAQALESGAAYAIVDEESAVIGDRCVLVPDVLSALQQLAAWHRRQLSIPFLAITGTNGKTTTKELVHAVLTTRYRTLATEGNLNNHIGVPLTILRIKPDTEFAIIEMGANHRREIASYCEIARPDYAIINNCGKAHLEGFGSVEGIREAKGELYDFIRANKGTIFINADLGYLQTMARGIDRQISYASQNTADYMAKAEEGAFVLKFTVTKPFEETIETSLVGNYNLANALAAVAVGHHFGVEKAQIKQALESYKPDNNRSQLLYKGTNTIILDAYNANPTSMQEAVKNFAQASLESKHIWLGAMKEMGQEEAREHEELVSLLQKYAWQDVILVGREFEPFKGAYHWFADVVSAAAYLKAHPVHYASILIKGSRGSKMEVLLDVL